MGYMYKPLIPICHSHSTTWPKAIRENNQNETKARDSKNMFMLQVFSYSMLCSSTNPAHSVGPANHPFLRTTRSHCADGRGWVTSLHFKGRAACLCLHPWEDARDRRALMTGGKCALRFFSIKSWSLPHSSKNQQPSGTSFCTSYLKKKKSNSTPWSKAACGRKFIWLQSQRRCDNGRDSTAADCQSRKLAHLHLLAQQKTELPESRKATNSQRPMLHFLKVP